MSKLVLCGYFIFSIRKKLMGGSNSLKFSKTKRAFEEKVRVHNSMNYLGQKTLICKSRGHTYLPTK
jgi:hypothetical protein